jgi:hypothetical protein
VIERFVDDDAGYRAWIYRNLSGYVVNAARTPDPDDLVLHRATCDTISPATGASWTQDYVKVCSQSRFELESWARESVGGTVTPCAHCAP